MGRRCKSTLIISTAFRCSGLRPTASGPPRRMSSHGSSCWPLMRRAKIPARSLGGTCKAQNSLTTSETLTFPTSLALNQRFSYLQQVLRSNDGEKGKQMNTTASLDRSTLGSSTLRRNSLLFWCALVAPVGIIVIGINFILNPVGASTAFGIPIHDPAAFPFMWVKGIRDIFSGLVILSSLWWGDRRATAILSAIAIFIPLGDGLVILSHLGFAPPIYIHWGTALYMTIVAALLLRRKAAWLMPGCRLAG